MDPGLVERPPKPAKRPKMSGEEEVGLDPTRGKTRIFADLVQDSQKATTTSPETSGENLEEGVQNLGENLDGAVAVEDCGGA